MNRRPVVLVTGATGFVGSALISHLRDRGFPVRGSVRDIAPSRLEGVPIWSGARLESPFGWQEPLSGCNVVIHTAARVHVMRDGGTDPLAEYRSINVAGTVRLATEAARAGIRRFVFLSSVKVNGEQSAPGRPFTATDAPAPQDPYGVSKLEAEVALKELGASMGMEITIVRPVLVYGPGVKGNFARLLRWIVRGIPLPLASANNLRSLVYLDNLVSLLARCTVHERAGNRVFLVRDDEDLSTSELLRRLADALDRPARLFPAPEWALRGAAIVTGQSDAANRLLRSLQVDDSSTRAALDWRPSVSVETGLRLTARWYATEIRR